MKIKEFFTYLGIGLLLLICGIVALPFLVVIAVKLVIAICVVVTIFAILFGIYWILEKFNIL
jgi:hypothetical protein